MSETASQRDTMQAFHSLVCYNIFKDMLKLKSGGSPVLYSENVCWHVGHLELLLNMYSLAISAISALVRLFCTSQISDM